MDQRTDEQLVEAYREGERGALETLIRRYQPELMGFLARLLGNRTAAEDVFQETFLQIHLSADVFDVSRRFKPWLFTIAANKARDYYRKTGRQTAMVDLSAPARGQDSGGSERPAAVTDFLADEGPGVEQRLSAEETRGLVRRTIDGMPHHLREILLLAYFQRLSYNEIAETLDIPLGTVKSRLHAAVAHFAQRWRRTGEDEAP